MNRDVILNAAVDEQAPLIFKPAEVIWKHPETGFKEWKTSAYLEQIFTDLGYELVKPEGIPGFYTDLDTGRPGPKLCLMGELDSLICAEHPDCDPVTKAVHACGHHAQAAGLVGAAAALKQPGVLDELCGSIRLMAVPAEELIEVGYREQLRAEGKIEFFGGKVEFMQRGYFEDVDLCVLIHTFDDPGMKHVYQLARGNNGCIVKNITVHGLASHAGGSPDKGINALYAAMQALQAVNALRETFRDDEHIRFHPIITEGGQAVNAIPEEVKIESYVRGASLEAIDQANRRINRAIAASVAAMGATVTLQDRPGYCPMHDDEAMNEVALAAMKRIVSDDEILIQTHWGTGCTDMGDLSAVLPTIQPGSSGSTGAYHGKDFQIADEDKAYVKPAKALVFIADELLGNNAEKANQIVAQFKPLYPSQKAYLEDARRRFLDKEAVRMNADGTITLNFQNGE